jgi:hypothetical protein
MLGGIDFVATVTMAGTCGETCQAGVAIVVLGRKAGAPEAQRQEKPPLWLEEPQGPGLS